MLRRGLIANLISVILISGANISSAVDLDLALESGFDSNYANAPSGSPDLEGAFFTQPSLEVRSPYFTAFSQAQIYSNAGASGGADLGGGPRYQFSWLRGALDTRVSYRLMRSVGISPSAASILGKAKKTVYSSVAGAIESSTTHTLRASTDYELGAVTLGNDVALGVGSYDESGRNDTTFDFSGRASFPLNDSLTTSVSFGWVSNGSSQSAYAYSGTRLMGTVVYELTDTIYIHGLIRLSERGYSVARNDAHHVLLVGIEKELSEALSVEFEISQAGASSTQADFSYQSVSSTVGITLSL